MISEDNAKKAELSSNAENDELWEVITDHPVRVDYLSRDRKGNHIEPCYTSSSFEIDGELSKLID